MSFFRENAYDKAKQTHLDRRRVTGLLAGAGAASAATTTTPPISNARVVQIAPSGLPVSASLAGQQAMPLDPPTTQHSCKGKNACKGQGGCSSGDNGCKGKNSCSGKAAATP